MGVLGVVWISKSGLGISIREPEVPFSVPLKRQKVIFSENEDLWMVFGIFVQTGESD